jgi:hypothetical protein
MPNPTGHTATLVAKHPGNTNATRHGVYSPRAHETRALEIHEELLGLPWIAECDSLAVCELSRLLARVELIDAALDADGRLEDSKGRARALLDHRLRASRRLQELLTALGTASV